MLVTDVGGLAEIVPHNKVGYVTSQNPIAIADSITRFLYQNNREDRSFQLNTIARKRKDSLGNPLLNGVDELMNFIL